MGGGWGVLVVADHRQSMRRASLPFDVVKGSAKCEMGLRGEMLSWLECA
jgi:hypothetical protein